MQKKNLNIEKIPFKVVQIKFLAMHITNQKLSFDIFKVEISSWSKNLIGYDWLWSAVIGSCDKSRLLCFSKH